MHSRVQNGRSTSIPATAVPTKYRKLHTQSERNGQLFKGGATQVPTQVYTAQNGIDPSTFATRKSAISTATNTLGLTLPFTVAENIKDVFPKYNAGVGDPLFRLLDKDGTYSTLDGLAYDKNIVKLLRLANPNNRQVRILLRGAKEIPRKGSEEIRRRLVQDLYLRLVFVGTAISKTLLQRGLMPSRGDKGKVNGQNNRQYLQFAFKGCMRLQNNQNKRDLEEGGTAMLDLPDIGTPAFGNKTLRTNMFKPIVRTIDHGGVYYKQCGKRYAAMFSNDGTYSAQKDVRADIAQPEAILRMHALIALMHLYHLSAYYQAGRTGDILEGARGDSTTLKGAMDIRRTVVAKVAKTERNKARKKLSGRRLGKKRSKFTFETGDRAFQLGGSGSTRRNRRIVRNGGTYVPGEKEFHELYYEGYLKGRELKDVADAGTGELKEMNLWKLAGQNEKTYLNEKVFFGLIRNKMTPQFVLRYKKAQVGAVLVREIQANFACKYMGDVISRIDTGAMGILKRGLKTC